MAYINEKYLPEDKTTDRERRQVKFQTLLLGNKRGPVEKQSYRRRANDITQAGLDASNYETARRNKREAAALEAARKKAEQATIRRIQLSIGQGQGPNLTPRYGDQSSGNYLGGATKGSFNAFMNAIAQQESGGRYGARNRGSGAMGKYQIMPGNIRGSKRGWDYEALGRDVSESEFMSSPQIQEAIARHKMQQYYNKYGPRGAAISWYAGEGALKYSPGALNRKQGDYSSISGYAQSILRRLGL